MARILQILVAALAFMALRNFTIITIGARCEDTHNVVEITYPFGSYERFCPGHKDDFYQSVGIISTDSSLGAQIFVVTASISFFYALFIIAVYRYRDEVYKKNANCLNLVSRAIKNRKNQKSIANIIKLNFLRTLPWLAFSAYLG